MNMKNTKKNTGLIVVLSIFAVLLVCVFAFIGMANGLNQSQQDVDEASGNIQTALQRRADLIPNLMESVKGSQKQEQAITKQITTARTQYYNAKNDYNKATDPNQQVSALNKQQDALNIMVGSINEKYPDLKSNDNMQTLMSQLEGTENRINVARTRYNSAVRAYNNKVVTFPSSMIASSTGHKTVKYFNGSAKAQDAPSVKF